ncbi:ABC transporter transmembrane domain-containing protein, partial [Salmonella enterica]|uniref:ABC transporter transmembrane domain-containing protein n=1 Tax=Salmonella enterica TaxID=28901 RepID=UPI000ACEAEDC
RWGGGGGERRGGRAGGGGVRGGGGGEAGGGGGRAEGGAAASPFPLFGGGGGGGGAAANRRNFLALARLSGHFLDRLRGMETLRIFGRGEAETESIRAASQDFRLCSREDLGHAFLFSSVLEFFTSLSIALVAVYFGFSYLGELNFGHYGTG